MNRHVHPLMLAALGSLINPPAVTFQRAPDGPWETWHERANPRPPAPQEAPFEPCHDHHNCTQWGGVHFHAIRFGEREWRNGWQDEGNASGTEREGK